MVLLSGYHIHCASPAVERIYQYSLMVTKGYRPNTVFLVKGGGKLKWPKDQAIEKQF